MSEQLIAESCKITDDLTAGMRYETVYTAIFVEDAGLGEGSVDVDVSLIMSGHLAASPSLVLTKYSTCN